MRVFASRRPDVGLTLDVGNREYVFERMLSHCADVAISGKPPDDERLVAEPLLDNHIACITSPDDSRRRRERFRRIGLRTGRGSSASRGPARARSASNSSRNAASVRIP